MATTIDENPDSLEAIEREQGKRFSGLKRAITRVLGIPVESKDRNIVQMVEALQNDYAAIEAIAEQAKFYKKRLKELRRHLIDIGARSDDPEDEE